MVEQWKNVNIKGYEIYEISNLGNVRRNGNILKQKTDRYGYRSVNLCVNNKRKSITVHRLVALTYIENPKNCATVNHKDGNKDNNCVNNLEWLTSAENTRHAQENNLFKFWYLVNVYNEKSGELIGQYNSLRSLCLKLKLINRTEVMIALNNGFGYRGYKFEKIKGGRENV